MVASTPLHNSNQQKALFPRIPTILYVLKFNYNTKKIGLPSLENNW